MNGDTIINAFGLTAFGLGMAAVFYKIYKTSEQGPEWPKPEPPKQKADLRLVKKDEPQP